MEGFFPASTLHRKKPQGVVPRCGSCGLYQKCNSPKMQPFGDGRAAVMIVGEAPGATEDEEGRPFVGKAGQYLRRVLRELGCDMDRDVVATNALSCRPRGNRTPTSEEIQHCRPLVTRAVRERSPSVVIALGRPGTDSVLGPYWDRGVDNIGTWRGWVIPLQPLNVYVCPTYHPSYLLRMEDEVLERQFKRDIAAALATQGKPWPEGPPSWEREVELVEDQEAVVRWLREIAGRGEGVVAWDYETNCLKPEHEGTRILSCAVAWGRGPEPEVTKAYHWTPDTAKATSRLLRSKIPKIGANIKFEDRWTRAKLGHPVRNWYWDTVVAAHVADNRPGITSVEFQALVRWGIPPWGTHLKEFLKSKPDHHTNRAAEDIAPNDLLLYNGLDAAVEYRVAADQMRELGYPPPWSGDR